MYTKLLVQRLGIIADNIKTAAFRGALRSKGTDDDVASGLHRVGDLTDIGYTVARRGKKMKDCAVMSHILSRGLQLDSSDVGYKPLDSLRGFP